METKHNVKFDTLVHYLERWLASQLVIYLAQQMVKSWGVSLHLVPYLDVEMECCWALHWVTQMADCLAVQMERCWALHWVMQMADCLAVQMDRCSGLAKALLMAVPLVWCLAQLMALRMVYCSVAKMAEMMQRALMMAGDLVQCLAEQMERRMWKVARVHLWALHLVLMLVGTL